MVVLGLRKDIWRHEREGKRGVRGRKGGEGQRERGEGE